MSVRRRRDKRFWFVVLGLFVAVFLFSFLSQRFKYDNESAEAASLAGFDPGYIISDYQMSNYDAMSEAEIQTFLNQKGNCRDTRTYLASQYSNYSYHIKDGHFVCLAEETFGEGVDYGDSAPNGESAAHIIYRAAQDYRINPKVIIVLLQKEQSLITDSWPNNRQFRSATGYGCPDTAPCNAEYYGFKNQVRKAAALFRTVLDGGWTNYPLGDNYIQYNPNAECGGSVVNIRSLATSALYRYTPYQPNAGALAAGYGTASCGAYGNRNFYLYFEDWFGGITAVGRTTFDDINDVYMRYGGESGLFGKRISSVMRNNGSGIEWIEFEHGFIVGNKEHGYHISIGKIREKWAAQNYEFGSLGFPKTDILTNNASGINWQEFDGGFIVGDDTHGYYYSMGGIRDVWAAQNYEFGSLGFPVTDIIEENNKEYQKYEGGYIIGNGRVGYHVSMGRIRDVWAENGYESGVLGFPITNILSNKASGIEWQEFEHGFIVGDEQHGYYISMGEIRDIWAAQNYEFGPLGFPTSNIIDEDGRKYQTYEHGTVYYSLEWGAWVE